MELNKLVGISALLYALSNPLGVTPIFLGLTKHIKPRSAPRVVAVAAFAVACLLVTAALLGQKILAFFNVGLADFRIAGGLLALFIAFEMFQARYSGFMQTIDEKTEAELDIHGIAVTPLAFPLLVGPAEMSIMITLAADRPTWPDKLALVGVSVLTSLLIALTLLAALPINRLIGRTGINIATRVMALIVAAIGVNFIFTGIRAELPGLIH